MSKISEILTSATDQELREMYWSNEKDYPADYSGKLREIYDNLESHWQGSDNIKILLKDEITQRFIKAELPDLSDEYMGASYQQDFRKKDPYIEGKLELLMSLKNQCIITLNHV